MNEDNDDKELLDMQGQISIATPNIPDDPDRLANSATNTTGYDLINLKKFLGYKPKNVTIVNDGTGLLFIKYTHDGTNWSSEIVKRYGQHIVLKNVSQIKLRSPTANNLYTITTHAYLPSYVIPVTNGVINRTAFTTGSIIGLNPPGVGANQLPDIIIPDGFAIVVKADRHNTDDIFVANSDANTGIAANRFPLGPKEWVGYYISNTNLIFVAGNSPNQNVSYTVESSSSSIATASVYTGITGTPTPNTLIQQPLTLKI